MWQELHGVAVTAEWFIVAVVNDVVLWQASHAAVVGMCGGVVLLCAFSLV